MSDRVCGVCRRDIKGLFRDHSNESCSSSLMHDRDKAESENKNLLARKEELLHYGRKQVARVEWLESENARLREVLERIKLSDGHHDMCQLDVRNCVVSCNVRRAKFALEGEKSA